MEIGNLMLKVSAPDRERLIESTGTTVEAMHELLGGPVIASTVAAALLACAQGDKIPDRHDLAVAIDNAGIDDVREAVRDLYRPSRKRGAASGEAQG